MSLLPYITDKDLFEHTKKVLDIALSAEQKKEEKFHKNVIDPFSAIFDAMRLRLSLSNWVEVEQSRQVQKTMQNAIGDFHEDILGSVEGWEGLEKKGIDIMSHEKKIVAEIKNKHNTMKGDTKQKIYDVLQKAVTSVEYKNYLGYAVHIIPNKKNPVDREFTPSYEGKHRPKNKLIREIDGFSFYDLVTEHNNSLTLLYKVLPKVIGQILKISPDSIVSDDLYPVFFSKAYFNSSIE